MTATALSIVSAILRDAMFPPDDDEQPLASLDDDLRTLALDVDEVLLDQARESVARDRFDRENGTWVQWDSPDDVYVDDDDDDLRRVFETLRQTYWMELLTDDEMLASVEVATNLLVEVAADFAAHCDMLVERLPELAAAVAETRSGVAATFTRMFDRWGAEGGTDAPSR